MKSGLSITELVQQLERQADLKHDVIVPSDKLAVFTETDDKGRGTVTKLHLPGEADLGEVAMNHTALRQMGQEWRVRADFADRLRGNHPGLFDHLVSGLMHREPRRRMVRCYRPDSDGGTGIARALVSEKYRRIDNIVIAGAVMPALAELPGVRFEDCAITEERMYVKAIIPNFAVDLNELITGEHVHANDVVQLGIVVKNSEVGAGTASVETMLYRLVCKNGLIVPQGLKMRHIGRAADVNEDYSIYQSDTVAADERALALKLRDAVKVAASETAFMQLATQFAETGQTQPMADPAEGVKVLAQRHKLSDGEGASILRHLATGGDVTLFGAINAVTRAAQDVESYDRAVELEELGARLMNMGEREWTGIATATAAVA